MEVAALLDPARLETIHLYSPPSVAATFGSTSSEEVVRRMFELLNLLPGPPMAVHTKVMLSP